MYNDTWDKKGKEYNLTKINDYFHCGKKSLVTCKVGVKLAFKIENGLENHSAWILDLKESKYWIKKWMAA